VQSIESRGTDVRTDVVDPGGTRTTTRLLPIQTRGNEAGREDGRCATRPNTGIRQLRTVVMTSDNPVIFATSSLVTKSFLFICKILG